MQPDGDAARAVVQRVCQEPEQLLGLVGMKGGGIARSDGRPCGSVPCKERDVVARPRGLGRSKSSATLLHRVPSQGSRPFFQGALERTLQMESLGLKAAARAAVARDDGRDALREERVFQLVVSLERDVPVEVGMGVDEPRRNDTSGAIDDDTRGADGLAREMRWIVPALMRRFAVYGRCAGPVDDESRPSEDVLVLAPE